MAVFYWGSSGNKVAEIQKRLKELQYYSDGVDGVFGANTYYAVVRFQVANGLVSDGVVGNVTLDKLSISTIQASQASQNDLDMLAKIIYAKGMGESYTGKVALGSVILNRVSSDKFPDSIEKNIYQNGTYNPINDGPINREPNSTAINAARDALNGWDPTGGALYFWNPETTSSKWIWSIPIKLKIGRYLFG